MPIETPAVDRLRRGGIPAFRSMETYYSYVRLFFRHVGQKAFLTLGLQFVLSVVGGISLLMLIPLLYLVAPTPNGRTSEISATVERGFRALELSLSLEAVLIAFLAVVAVQALLRFRETVLNEEVVADFARLLRDRIYEAMAQADWMCIVRMKASETTHVISHEIGQISHATQQQLSLVGGLLVTVVHLSIAFYLSPAFSALALACGAALVFAMRPLDRDVTAIGSLMVDNWRRVHAALYDHVTGIKVSKSFGLEQSHTERFRELSSGLVDYALRYARTKGKTQTLQHLGGAVALCTIVYLSIKVFVVPLAELLVLVYVFSRLLPRFSSMHQNWHRILHALPSFEAYRDLYDKFDEARESPSPDLIGRVRLDRAIELDDVTFAYDPHGPPALEGINLSVSARSMTALVGPSGTGKTTLADLLIGLLQPTSGRVLVNGELLAGHHLHAWRRSVGYVPQDTFLFHDTIRANMLFAAPQATEKELWEALEVAAADFVGSMPEGLDTVVGDRGIRLSGGERQRIALARALLRRPTLLVLDEATSNLDSENEQRIQKAVDALHGSLTLIIIAHRLSTVRRADHIVILREGRVADRGSWDELLSSAQPHFRTMVDAAGRIAIQ